MKDQLIGCVKDGKLLLDEALLQRHLAKHEGKEVLLTLEQFEPEKSSAQRGYYFAAEVSDAAEFFTVSAVEGKILGADEELQDLLYEALTSGRMSPDQFRLAQEKLRLWQSLSRELITAIP